MKPGCKADLMVPTSAQQRQGVAGLVKHHLTVFTPTGMMRKATTQATGEVTMVMMLPAVARLMVLGRSLALECLTGCM